VDIEIRQATPADYREIARVDGISFGFTYSEQDFTDIFVATQQPTVYDLKIEIKPDNRVYFEIPRMDVGQGVMTTIATMMADNLDVPLENMDVALSKAEPKRNDAQLTGGSHNVRVLWDPVRVICANMRGRLVTAAAQKMGVPVTALRTEDAYVHWIRRFIVFHSRRHPRKLRAPEISAFLTWLAVDQHLAG